MYYSTENLKQIFAAYQEFSGIDIEDSIQIDKDLDLSSAQLVLKEESDQFMQKYQDAQLIKSEELFQLSFPYCGACIKAFLEKKALMPGKQELFLTIIE